MSKLTFRNKQGDLVDIPTVAATRVKNEFGAVLEEAIQKGALSITRHKRPQAVLVSVEEFKALAGRSADTLGDLEGEFDALLQRMQTANARKGVEAAFKASPTQLGRLAVEAVVKDR